MKFPFYDPVPDPDDDRELSLFLRRLDQTLNPIALAICFAGGCHIASVWIREVSFSEVIENFGMLFKKLVILAYNGPTVAAKGLKGIGETYTDCLQWSFNQPSRSDRLDNKFENNRGYLNWVLETLTISLLYTQNPLAVLSFVIVMSRMDGSRNSSYRGLKLIMCILDVLNV